MRLAGLEAEAVELIDSSIDQLDRALRSYRAHDLPVARSVVVAARRRYARAGEVYESGLALLGVGRSQASDLRRTAGLLQVVACIQRIEYEIASIAQLAQAPGEGVDRVQGPTGELTLRRLAGARDAFARQSGALASEVMGAAPQPVEISPPLLRGSAVAVARCLKRIEDDAAEIGEQVMCISSGLFEEMADSPWVDEAPSAAPAP